MLWGNVDGKDVHLVTLKTEKLEAIDSSTCGCLGAEQLMQSCPEADICSLGAALVAVRVKAGFYSKLQEPGVFPC